MKFESITGNNGNEISGPFLCRPDINEDVRGYFYESWNQRSFEQAVNKKIDFVQDNESYSLLGVLRGLHYQLNPQAQGKLLRVSSGEIYDVIIDLRINSSTFMQSYGTKINDINKTQIWIPEGFAHGFLTLSKYAKISYKVTNYWSKNYERTIIWDDIDLAINWPLDEINIKNPIVSIKDSAGLSLNHQINLGEVF